MSRRNLSMREYYLRRTERHVPKHRFVGTDEASFRAWKSELTPALLETVGPRPNRVPLNAEVEAEWTDEGCIKQRVVIDVEDGLSAILYVFRPADATGKLPVILCCHGHGPHGKDSVMGNRGDPERAAAIARVNYDYGLQLAQQGFVTVSLDFRGFGERNDAVKPNTDPSARPSGRDPCEYSGTRSLLLGETLLAGNLNDARCAIDYVLEQPFADADCVGVMGLSFGGTMTTWIAITDDRIKAADVICYSDRFADFGMRDVNLCLSQVTPGLYGLCDVPDLHGLIAPKPLLVEIGSYDGCFKVNSAMSCYREVEKIYTAAGVRDRLELELFSGGHRWGGGRSAGFFRDAFARVGTRTP